MQVLRPELTPPTLDQALVARLAKLADRIDGANPGQWEDELAEFNSLAGTNLEYRDFQGIYKAEDHDVWVRKILCEPAVRKVPDVTEAELLDLFERVCQAAGDQHEHFFWLRMLEENLDPQVSDLIYWPGEYFGDGDNTRELTPRQMLDAALARRARKQHQAGR